MTWAETSRGRWLADDGREGWTRWQCRATRAGDKLRVDYRRIVPSTLAVVYAFMQPKHSWNVQLVISNHMLLRPSW